MPGQVFLLINKTSISLFLFATMVPAISWAQDIDFRKDILPILEEHCFDCHGNGNVEGDLVLESVAAMQIGGHSGSPILSSTLEDSELYLRITSKSEGYRMPKKGDPLPQEDIDKIAKWLNQISGSLEGNKETEGAGSTSSKDEQIDSPATPDVAESNINRSLTPSPPALLGTTGQTGESVPQSQVVSLVVATVFICLLLFWLFYRIATSGSSDAKKISSGSERTSALMSMVIGAVSCLLLIGFGFFYWRCGKLVEENESLRSQVEFLKPKMAPLVEVGPGNLPLPPHPLHPPRLGGQYYRGNDERDESLFNHGFYRTATIDLHLVDADGNRLEWGDESGGDLAVEIRVERAPNATRELFNSRVHGQTSIEHYSQSTPGVSQKLMFEVQEEEQLWSARIPLPEMAMAERNVQHSRGMIYLMYGVQPGGRNLPRPHFAVRYNLKVKDGKITQDSVLWMGSIYTLNNRVLVPDEKEILLDRWFDWRPIPVIEGEGSTDPSLLGVDEHLKQ